MKQLLHYSFLLQYSLYPPSPYGLTCTCTGVGARTLLLCHLGILLSSLRRVLVFMTLKTYEAKLCVRVCVRLMPAIHHNLVKAIKFDTGCLGHEKS